MLAVAVLALIVAFLAMTRPAPAAVSMPSAPAATSAPVHPRITTPAPQRPAPPREKDAHGVHPYVVRPGDSLWSVSLRAYGTGHDWGRIYAANRAAIGSNPGVIQPGERLIIPRQ